ILGEQGPGEQLLSRADGKLHRLSDARCIAAVDRLEEDDALAVRLARCLWRPANAPGPRSRSIAPAQCDYAVLGRAAYAERRGDERRAQGTACDVHQRSTHLRYRQGIRC